MAVFWKLIRKEIRQKPARFLILVLGMTAAVFLITVMTIFSTSCLQAMIRQEIEENGPYKAVASQPDRRAGAKAGGKRADP